MKPIRVRRMICLCATGFFLSTPLAQAQPIPGSADPSRIRNDRIEQAPNFNNVQQAAPKKTVKAAIPEGAEKIVFVLKDVTADGMTAYSPEEIAPLYEKYIGKQASLATVFEIAAALQKKYLDDGYTLTKVMIAQQPFTDGHIHLTVVEGYVGEVEFRGTFPAAPIIDDAVAKIGAMRPLNTKRLERIMLILNDQPGVKFSAVLATARKQHDEAGVIRLVLEGETDSGLHGSAGVNNAGSNYSGPFQILASANLAHVCLPYTNLGFVTTVSVPFREMNYGAVSYSVPLFGVSGTTFTVNASSTLTAPGDSLRSFQIDGVSRELSLGLSYPLIRQRDKTWVVDAEFSGKNSRTNIIGTRLYDDRLRVLSIGTNYSRADSWSGINALQFRFSKGFDILGARETGSFDLSRLDGHSDFSKVQASIGRRQALPKNFELYGMVQSQYAFDPLLSAEEIGFGGSQMGRGYDPSEITGDHGIIGSVELRYNTALPGGKTTLQPYAFYDVGKLWNIDPSDRNKVSAASAGAGMRADIGTSWNTDFNVSIPLTRTPDNPPHYTTDNGPRFLVSIMKNF